MNQSVFGLFNYARGALKRRAAGGGARPAAGGGERAAAGGGAARGAVGNGLLGVGDLAGAVGAVPNFGAVEAGAGAGVLVGAGRGAGAARPPDPASGGFRTTTRGPRFWDFTSCLGAGGA